MQGTQQKRTGFIKELQGKKMKIVNQISHPPLLWCNVSKLLTWNENYKSNIDRFETFLHQNKLFFNSILHEHLESSSYFECKWLNPAQSKGRERFPLVVKIWIHGK